MEMLVNIVAAGAVYREFEIYFFGICFRIFWIFLIFGPNMGPRGSGSGLNERGVSANPILAGFRLKRSHGDPFRAKKHRFVDLS